MPYSLLRQHSTQYLTLLNTGGTNQHGPALVVDALDLCYDGTPLVLLQPGHTNTSTKHKAAVYLVSSLC